MYSVPLFLNLPLFYYPQTLYGAECGRHVAPPSWSLLHSTAHLAHLIRPAGLFLVHTPNLAQATPRPRWMSIRLRSDRDQRVYCCRPEDRLR